MFSLYNRVTLFYYPLMHPVLFRIPIFDGLTIYTYGAMVAVGFVAGILYIQWEARRVGEDPARVMDLVFWIIVAAIIGSRLYYILVTEPGTLASDPLSFFKIWRGGLVFQGGVLGAFMVGIWWVKRHKLPVLKYCDIFAPAGALGHFLGRIGCFMSGCCYGRPTPPGSWFAVTFPKNPASFAPGGTPLYPTQLMESFGELVIFLFLFSIRKKKSFDGQLMAVYLASYAVLRFVVEFFRGDGTRNLVIGRYISAAQIVSLIMVAAAIWLWTAGRKRKREVKL